MITPVLKFIRISMKVENYREIVIKHLPNLVKLDNHQISQEERVNSQKVIFNISSVNNPTPISNENEAYEEEKWSKPPSSHGYFSKPQPVEEKNYPEEKWQKKTNQSQNYPSHQNHPSHQKKPSYAP